LKGIWAANDEMALGALITLRKYRLNRKIQVSGFNALPEATDAVQSGELVATVYWEPFWKGGMGLSLAYHMWKKTLDPERLKNKRRDFLGPATLITQDTIDEYKAAEQKPLVDWTDYWGRVRT
jgi:ribose transport system substrate-binding protein